MKINRDRYAMIVLPCEPLSETNASIIENVLSKGGRVCLAIRDDQSRYSPLEIMGSLMESYEKQIGIKSVYIMVIPNITSSVILPNTPHQVFEHSLTMR